MDLEQIRKFCLSLPHVTERVQWGSDLLFCVGNKMFAVAGLDAKYPTKLSFKCTAEKFAELIEQEGIIPAPYLARYHWVALEDLDALSQKELKELLRAEKVYAELFLTPGSDPWLGLFVPDAYTGLENGGVVKNR
jgi:predicted DNA-binding protein (MmcQ/YjbR family)